MFSAISRNWRARPLESHAVVIETIRAVTASTGLTVDAELDTNTYERGITIPDKDMKALETSGILTRHDFHGESSLVSSRVSQASGRTTLIHHAELQMPPRTP